MYQNIESDNIETSLPRRRLENILNKLIGKEKTRPRLFDNTQRRVWFKGFKIGSETENANEVVVEGEARPYFLGVKHVLDVLLKSMGSGAVKIIDSHPVGYNYVIDVYAKDPDELQSLLLKGPSHRKDKSIITGLGWENQIGSVITGSLDAYEQEFFTAKITVLIERVNTGRTINKVDENTSAYFVVRIAKWEQNRRRAKKSEV